MISTATGPGSLYLTGEEELTYEGYREVVYSRRRDGRKRAGTRTHVRRLLYGRTDRGVDGGGLLGKVPGADVRKEIAAGFGKDGETVRRQRNMIVVKARPDISLYSSFYRFDADAWKQDPDYIPEGC